jgi:hypothetical protein
VPTGHGVVEGINELLSKRDLMKATTTSKALAVLSLFLSVGIPPALPQPDAPQAAQPQSPKEAQTEGQKGEKPPLRPEELDQLLASIALYPDDLIAQMLSASTYPVEVVQAARFLKENAQLKGEQLMAAAKDKDWDPSVKAMLQFPDVLKMMDEKLDWTTKLGDAFLSQERDVMDSIQRLRRKANEAGSLQTNQEQKVIVEAQTQTIIIQPANPQIVYVPTYNPTVVYGTWPYPAYPPYPVYPPGYVATSVFSFAAGVAVGAAWGGWGGWHSNWHGGDVNINVNRYNNFTRNSYTNANRYQLNQTRTSQAWQHNPEHRRGAQYTNQATAQRFGESRAGTRTVNSAARGYEGGAGARAAGGGAGTRDLSRAGGGGAGARAATSSPGASAFSATSSGGSARAASVRGQASRSSPSFSGGGTRTGGGGGARTGGGGARAGRS